MRLPRHPWPWFAAFAAWFCTLWYLSSGVPDIPDSLGFHASDKILHFGYFFGGAGLLSAAIYRFKPGLKAGIRILICVAIVSSVGALDEVHQSYVPGRSGNDPGDLAADFLGALAGAFVFQACRKFLD